MLGHVHEHDGVTHDSSQDIFLDLNDALPLTEEDIEWGVDVACGRIEDNWVRTMMRNAASDAAALGFIKAEGRWWGRYGADGYAGGHVKGIEVKREGRGGIIPFAEIVQRVRHPAVARFEQLALF